MRPPSETSGPNDRAIIRSSASTAMTHAVSRLVELLDRETLALRKRQPLDMNDLCDRKNQALLELSRISRSLDSDAWSAELAPVLQVLRKKLDENSAALRLHLEAARELADILTATMREAESDGTYSKGAGAGLAG